MADLLVLCYHALSPDWPAALSTTPDRFERQLDWLARRGYRGVTFSEAVLDGGSGRRVAITFDDAYRSVLERARPLLDRHGWPATIYAPSGLVDRDEPLRWDGIDEWLGGPHEPELLPLSWRQLGELADSGWEVGSHTISHPRLTQLADAELRRELEESRHTCEERLGRPCPSIAYPYGDVDARVVEAAQAAGYRSGAGLPAVPHRPRALEWPRVGIYYGDDDRRFRLKASRLVRTARTALAERRA